MGLHVNVGGLRIRRHATPVGTAISRKNDRAFGRRTFLMEEKWREWPGVVKPAGFFVDLLTGPGVLRRGVLRGHDIFLLETGARQGRRLQWERLRGRIPLSGHIARRNRTLLDTEYRFAGFTVEDEHPALLSNLCECWNRLSVLFDVDQNRRGRQVRIPQIVMNGLEMPFVLSGFRIDGDHRIAKQVVAFSVSAIIVCRR